MRVSPAQLLLPLDLRQEKFFPVLGAVHVARSQLGRQTVTLAIEQQQRVIAARLEMPVVGTLLLLAAPIFGLLYKALTS